MSIPQSDFPKAISELHSFLKIGKQLKHKAEWEILYQEYKGHKINMDSYITKIFKIT